MQQIFLGTEEVKNAGNENVVKAYKAYIIKKVAEGNQTKADLEHIRADLEEER